MKVARWSTFYCLAVIASLSGTAEGQEAKRRWEFMNQIRREQVDMWITVGPSLASGCLFESSTILA